MVFEILNYRFCGMEFVQSFVKLFAKTFFKIVYLFVTKYIRTFASIKKGKVMCNNRRNEYLNNFRRFLSKYLKPSVGVQTKTYSYEDGCVIVVSLGVNLQVRDEYQTTYNLNEALQKTTLFEDIPNSLSVQSTSIFLIGRKIVLIKNSAEDLWSENSAKNDVEKIIKELRNNS